MTRAFEITTIAEQILANRPSPAVRVRLLRDVLERNPNTPELVAARRELHASNVVLQLAEEQRKDGSWGRFHSSDTASHQKFPTTEFAVSCCLKLGLEADHSTLSQAAKYISGY